MARGHHHIIVAVDYFIKWEEDMPTVKSDGEITTHFIFNQIISQFGILRELVMDYEKNFKNKMMDELCLSLWYKKEHSSSYYP